MIMGRQLNIRSDQAFAAAHHIADELGISTTKAVEIALQSMLKSVSGKSRISELKAKQNFELIMAAARISAQAAKPGNSSDHSDFYDENGLPK